MPPLLPIQPQQSNNLGTQPTIPTTPTVRTPQQQQQNNQQSQNPIFTHVPANQHGPSPKTLASGVLFSCKYTFYKHDPSPIVLMSRMYMNQNVGGVNIHYLSYPYVKYLIDNFCGKMSFSYQSIKNDRYIIQAFRTYKRNGLREVKILDKTFLDSILGKVRKLKPSEIKVIREEIQRQLKEKMNPKATDLSRNYSRYITPTVDNLEIQAPAVNSLGQQNINEG